MAELSSKQRRRGLETADAVAALASEATDAFIKRELYRAVNNIRKHFGFTEAEKRDEVFRRILVGASTVNDLIRETGFAQPDIWRITKELEDAGRIYLQKTSFSGNGRPACLFFAVEIVK